MRFYTKTHAHYCGIDLHAKTMYLCILDREGQVLLHKNMRSCPETFVEAVEPYRDDLVVAVECMFTWYWLADLCRREGIAFVLGHALYMKAIHGGKAKNDKIDSLKIATLLRGGSLPKAYVYPPEMRATRDLLRRRLHLVRRRGNLLAHIQNTHHQYNLPEPPAKIAYKANREGVADAFEEPDARKSMEVDFMLIEQYDKIIKDMELHTPRPITDFARSRELARSWRSRFSTRSTTSNASSEFKTSSRTRGW
jgi:transposase